MRAVVLEKPGKFSLVDIDTPAGPGPGEALLRIRRVGICGTDLHAFQGNQPMVEYPRILGHELAVEVLDVGRNGQGFEVGDRCAVEPYLTCGSCVACRRGRTNCCVNLKCLGVHTDGGMRDRMVLPISKLRKSKTLSLDHLALVETLGIGAHAVERAGLDALDTVLVIGVGPIGLSVVEFARQADVKVLVMDMNPKRLEFCRRVFQVDDCINAGEDPLREIRDRLSGDLPTVVFDCTGNSQSMTSAFGYVGHSGKLVFVGVFSGDDTFHDPMFHAREMTVLGSRNATAKDHYRIIQLMEAGKIDVTPWVTHRLSPAGLLENFPRWMNADSPAIKTMVDW